ncbi:hypothetical protein [Pseudomonas syringae]|uniref:hypothetical protein n=1 Tax=Pseudomonas syringae TaxID=317 RepID=UPI002463E16F|nr:hypothetical protein [Pseudomonas syringae]MDH4602436.1 hypothetical protein [Pseudomonas syringae pv. papulans]
MAMNKKSYPKWETQITEQLASRLDISYSDASGVIEAHSFHVMQSWDKGLDSAVTTDALVELIKE